MKLLRAVMFGVWISTGGELIYFSIAIPYRLRDCFSGDR